MSLSLRTNIEPRAFFWLKLHKHDMPQRHPQMFGSSLVSTHNLLRRIQVSLNETVCFKMGGHIPKCTQSASIVFSQKLSIIRQGAKIAVLTNFSCCLCMHLNILHKFGFGCSNKSKYIKNAIIVITVTLMILQMISVILLSFHFVFYGLSSDTFFFYYYYSEQSQFLYRYCVYHSA